MGWAVRLVSAVLMAWMVTPAPAQTDQGLMTEAQKRRIHLPYVRAATDCLARGIQYNTEPLRLARTGQWYDALGAIPNGYCSNDISALVTSHDNLYGYGTGKAFFTGPYWSDLPRALGNRLRGEFERQAAVEAQAEAARRQEIARQEAEQRSRIEQADRAFALLRERMYDCTTGQVLQLVGSSETAEVLATAAMTVCRSDVSNTIQAAQAKYRLENPSGTLSWTEFEAAIRRNVVTNAVQAKAALNAPRPAPPMPPAPPLIAATVTPPSVQPVVAPAPTPVLECLRTVAKAREGKFVNRDELVKAMLELCRPEIETVARTSFLKDEKSTLEKQRERVLEDALREARVIVGAVAN